MNDPVEGLLEDVTEMTRQAAIDGLTLASVYADVRLVLDLGASAELPQDVVRACAVAWADAHRQLDRDQGAPVLAWDELEDRLWGAPAGPGAEVPTWAVLVEGGNPLDGAGRPDLLPPVDVLHAIAVLLATRLGRGAEHVALIPGSGTGRARVVALVRGDADRAEQARTWALELASVGTAPAVTLHPLGEHPDGILGALRELTTRTAPDG